MNSDRIKAITCRAGAVSPAHRGWAAFTLIELLAVIAVIALLAALIVPLTGLAATKMKLAKAKVKIKDLEMVIQNYKETKGFYPPDNRSDWTRSPLFYELSGCLYDVDTKAYRPFSNTNSAPVTTNLMAAALGVDGIVNSTQNQNEEPVFHHDFPRTDFAEDLPLNPGVQVLICPVPKVDGTMNPWNYNSTSPTNNPNTYDLWVDLVLRGKTNRICNWSTAPIVL